MASSESPLPDDTEVIQLEGVDYTSADENLAPRHSPNDPDVCASRILEKSRMEDDHPIVGEEDGEDESEISLFVDPRTSLSDLENSEYVIDSIPYIGTIHEHGATPPTKQSSSTVGPFTKEDLAKLSAEEYRRLVYGGEHPPSPSTKTSSRSSFRRLSQRLSQTIQRQRSSLIERLPETPAGWTVLACTLASAFLGYEIQLQKSLTAPPLVFGQVLSSAQNPTTPIEHVYQHLTQTPQSILRRTIQPSLFVGTRGSAASTAAYLMQGPQHLEQHIRFREIMDMTQDGARVAVDWELPSVRLSADQSKIGTQQNRKDAILHGPIQHHVVLILHGINNHAGFGYVQSLMRACCDKGWVAAGLNFRGCGGVPLATPRVYNGAYTGDLRCVVHSITARLAPNRFLFLVGHSLGANLVAKFLGEEGLSDTLPPQVAGAVTLGNPMHINAGNLGPIYSPLLALGVKKAAIENLTTLRQMKEPQYQHQIRKAILGGLTLEDFDNAMAPVMVRNDETEPFAFRVGFDNGKSYWHDASSYRFTRYISVPTMQIMAADDVLCYNPFKQTFTYSLANPNIMVVETRCGGHLGWQESPPPNPDGSSPPYGTSWSNVAATDFIQAVLKTKESSNDGKRKGDGNVVPRTKLRSKL